MITQKTFYMHMVLPANCKDCDWKGFDYQLRYEFGQPNESINFYESLLLCPVCRSRNIEIHTSTATLSSDIKLKGDDLKLPE